LSDVLRLNNMWPGDSIHGRRELLVPEAAAPTVSLRHPPSDHPSNAALRSLLLATSRPPRLPGGAGGSLMRRSMSANPSFARPIAVATAAAAPAAAATTTVPSPAVSVKDLLRQVDRDIALARLVSETSGDEASH
ncbi:hypothetical protein HK405_000335, partial [Cladochytrium tenue]